MASSTTSQHILGQAASDGIALLKFMQDNGDKIPPAYLSDNASKAIIMLWGTKVGFGVGARIGNGFLLAKLPPKEPFAQIRWSAPLFLKVRVAQLGLNIGYAKSYSYIVAMSSKILTELQEEGSHTLFGCDNTFVFTGSATESKSDIIALSSGDSDLIVAAVVKGAMLDFSLAGGSMSVDFDLLHRVYGRNAIVSSLLSGDIPPPDEMNPLYEHLTGVVKDYQHSPPPHLSRRSVEMMTTGVDIDRRIITSSSARVLQTGTNDHFNEQSADVDD